MNGLKSVLILSIIIFICIVHTYESTPPSDELNASSEQPFMDEFDQNSINGTTTAVPKQKSKKRPIWQIVDDKTVSIIILAAIPTIVLLIFLVCCCVICIIYCRKQDSTELALTPSELIKIKPTPSELNRAKITPSKFHESGGTYEQMAELGATPSQLVDAGADRDTLVKLGATKSQLSHVGYHRQKESSPPEAYEPSTAQQSYNVKKRDSSKGLIKSLAEKINRGSRTSRTSPEDVSRSRHSRKSKRSRSVAPSIAPSASPAGSRSVYPSGAPPVPDDNISMTPTMTPSKYSTAIRPVVSDSFSTAMGGGGSKDSAVPK